MSAKARRLLRAAAPVGTVLASLLILAAFLAVDWNWCEHGWITPQPVDINPFGRITFPEASKCVTDTLDLSIFDSYESVGGNCGEIRGYRGHRIGARDTVWSHIYVDISTDSSDFAWQCLAWRTSGDMSEVTRGATDNGWYCISPVRQERTMAGPVCLPSKEYWSYVVYQSGDWVIGIQEYTSDPKSRRKDAVIWQIAQELLAAQPRDGGIQPRGSQQ